MTNEELALVINGALRNAGIIVHHLGCDPIGDQYIKLAYGIFKTVRVGNTESNKYLSKWEIGPHIKTRQVVDQKGMTRHLYPDTDWKILVADIKAEKDALLASIGTSQWLKMVRKHRRWAKQASFGKDWFWTKVQPG